MKEENDGKRFMYGNWWWKKNLKNDKGNFLV